MDAVAETASGKQGGDAMTFDGGDQRDITIHPPKVPPNVEVRGAH